jgi:hypothetical protein
MFNLEITVEPDNNGYLANCNGCLGWGKMPRDAIAVAIMSAMAEQGIKTTINGKSADLQDVVTGDAKF